MRKAIAIILLNIFISCQAKEKKPNILWITFEDTSPHFIGCYGNKDARTPNMDKLAQNGVRFTNAFSTGTVSSPSRTAIITGVKVYETGTGHHRSKYPIPDYIKGFPYYMQQAGYYTSNNQKTDYNVANEAAFINEAWNESSGQAGWWGRKPGQPFCAVFNFMDSHQSRTMTNSYDWYKENILEKLAPDERIEENDFDMPPFYRDTPEMRKQFARVYNSIKLTDKKIGELLNRLEVDHLKDSTIIFLFADHGEGIPRGKTNGINLGYRVPFIVWFPEMYKNLSPWGTGTVTDELVDFADLAPTMIALVEGKVPKYMKGRKLIGYERSKPKKHLYLSSDRCDNGFDMVRTVTDGKYVYSRNFMPFMPELRYIRYMEIGEIKQHMRKDFEDEKLNKLQESIFKPRPAEFLFNIEKDVWETKNLVDVPEYMSVLKKMRKLMGQEITRSRDIMFLPEYEIGLLSDTTMAYLFRMNDNLFPIEQIYQAASLSGLRGEDVTTEQIQLLNDENDIVRYWAILGLRSQQKSNILASEKALVKAMFDTYKPVSITASAILYQNFKNKQAEENLKKFCADDNMDLALLAINYLLYVEDKKPFIKTIQEVHEMSGRNYNVKAACMDFLASLGLVPNTLNFEK